MVFLNGIQTHHLQHFQNRRFLGRRNAQELCALLKYRIQKTFFVLTIELLDVFSQLVVPLAVPWVT